VIDYDDDHGRTHNLDGYEDYLRRELPPIVRRQLEQELERELNFVEEGLKRRVIDIVRNLQVTLFRSYQQLEDGAPEPEASVRPTESPATLTDAGDAENTIGSPIGSMPDPLNILDDPWFGSFDGESFNFGQLSAVPWVGDPSAGFSDSGYSSTNLEIEKQGEDLFGYPD
jgi:hypothetical protein